MGRSTAECGCEMRREVQVMAMLVEMRITDVAGFDLSALDRYRYCPSIF